MTIASGTCGDNLTWVLEDDYSLVISGSGAMNDYSFVSNVPWNSYSANIVSVELPSGITSIGENAFYGCISLVSITIPDGVTSINAAAFHGCTSLTSISIPDSVVSILQSSFRNCSSLTSISIPDGITTIAQRAFNGCSSLASVTIPDDVTSIEQYAFQGCTSLATVSILGIVSTVGQYAFQNCPSLTHIELQTTPTTIGTSAFALGTSSRPVTCTVESPGNAANGAFNSYKNNYTTFTYHGIGEYIGSDGLTYTFINNALTISGTGASTSLYFGMLTTSDNTTVNMREMVTCHYGPDITSISSYAFGSQCTQLTSITVDENNANYTSADGILFNKDKTDLIKCPVTIAGEYTIPDTVATISGYAFNPCPGLTAVTVPSSVTNIYNHAFGYCTSLQSSQRQEGLL